MPSKTYVVLWAWKLLLLIVVKTISTSCTSDSRNTDPGCWLPLSQSIAACDAALTNRCVTASKKKLLDVSCKYLTAVNVIAYKVIFKCSFKHPIMALAAF